MKRFLEYNSVFIIMTVLVCYFTFYISESDFLKIKVSGILAFSAIIVAILI